MAMALWVSRAGSVSSLSACVGLTIYGQKIVVRRNAFAVLPQPQEIIY